MATWVAILENHTRTRNGYVEAQKLKEVWPPLRSPPTLGKPTSLKTKKGNLKTHHSKQPHPKKRLKGATYNHHLKGSPTLK
jgi:hypothetical protein